MLDKKQWTSLKRLTKLAKEKSDRYTSDNIVLTQERMIVTGAICCLETTHRLEELVNGLSDKEEACFTTRLKLDKSLKGNNLAYRASARLAGVFEHASKEKEVEYNSCEIENNGKKLTNIEVGSAIYSLPKSMLEDCKALELDIKIVKWSDNHLLYASGECTKFAYVLYTAIV